MNKSIISMFLRSFANKATSGIRRRLKISGSSESSADLEDFEDNPDDLDAQEGDFMNIDKAQKSYEREKVTKNELLKRQIVMSRFFNKENDPNFLTYMEKSQIRALHESDPDEWTITKLSNSFPVLPHIVKKIIRSKWQPTSTYQILKYDQNVMENWKNFRAGNLAVSYQLKVHLMKFEDRKISSMGREELAVKFIPPKFEIPKPQSQLFASIAEGCIDKSKSEISSKQLKSGTDVSSNTATYSHLKPNVQKEASFQFSAVERVGRMEQSNKRHKKQRPMKFNEFIEQKIDKLCYESPARTIELLETCKEYGVEPIIIGEAGSDQPVDNADNTSTDLTEAPVSNNLPVPQTRSITHNLVNSSTETSLNTFIKARNRKVTETEDYTMRVKIPKTLYQKGMTYRIKDCYYDDDGQFLYRVIGM